MKRVDISSYIHIEDAVREQIQYLQDRKEGKIKTLRTPWKKVNQANFNGLEWGTITTLGGMSGSGKTTMVNQLVTELDKYNKNEEIHVLFFTIEMEARKVVGRSFSNMMEVSVQELNTKLHDKQLDMIKEKIGPSLSKKNITYIQIAETPEVTAKQIAEFISVRMDKKVLVVYDHSLLPKRSASYNERESLIRLYTELNTLKKRFKNSQYLVLSQLNRNIEEDSYRLTKKSLHYPKKSDFFGSDAAYQFSDLVMVIHNPHRLGIDCYGPNSLPTKGYLFIHMLKIREGQSGRVTVVKDSLKYNKIASLTKEEFNEFKKLIAKNQKNCTENNDN